MSDLPPWEPIADWLCRIEDGDHNQATESEKRKYHEKTAKAIAYDIATHDTERIDPDRIKQELAEQEPFLEPASSTVEVCPKCSGHGGVPGDKCERCDGTGRADRKSNI